MGIKDFFLSRSGSYQYYKDYHDNNKSNDDELKKIKKDIRKLKKQVKQQDKLLDSHYKYFNSLYLDYELTPRKLLKDTQDLSVELLKFIDKICIENDLKWWLDYGTLLGAVRHFSFIPWDDDTDIAMMRKDYIKLNEILPDIVENYDLGEFIKLYYVPRKYKDKTINSFLQVFVVQNIMDGSQQALAGVDVFPYDYITDFNLDNLDEDYQNARKKFYRALSEDKSDALDIYYDALNLDLNPADNIISGVEGVRGPVNMYDVNVLDAGEIFPLKEMEFAGEKFYAPHNHDYYLRDIYGDYMNIPKNIHHHARIDRFRYNQNNDELYDKCLNKLKSVNERI